MSNFKSYKIRDGVHIPSEKYKENWNAIFGKKPKKPTNGDTMNKKKMPIGTMVGSMKLVAYMNGNPVFKPTNPKTLEMIKSLNKKED
jgi:hypothetical protein